MSRDAVPLILFFYLLLRHQGIVSPPSTERLCPVTASDALAAKYTQASAKSATVVVFCKGVDCATNPNTSSVVSELASVVCKRPPATRFTRIPFGPSSLAKLRVRPRSADLVVV